LIRIIENKKQRYKKLNLVFFENKSRRNDVDMRTSLLTFRRIEVTAPAYAQMMNIAQITINP
jgi:hypothetical protein